MHMIILAKLRASFYVPLSEWQVQTMTYLISHNIDEKFNDLRKNNINDNLVI